MRSPMQGKRSHASFDDVAAAILAAERIAIFAHVRPDGDAIGSQIGLGSSLRALGKEVILINEDGCPANLQFLAESETVRRPSEEVLEVDLCVALDTANQARLGERSLASVAGCDHWINIDHHVSNEGYGDLVHVDADAPATGQIIFELIQAADWPLTDAARDALFVAISTDTGAFKYPATTARTYEVGAQLLRAGADCGELSSQTYERYPFRRIELMRELLQVLELTCDGRSAHWLLTLELKTRLGVLPEDGDSLIDIMRGIDSVLVATFFEELRDGTLRVSMRSKSRVVDVCKICAEFGGGGHPLAAGARIAGGETSAAIESVLKIVHERIEHR